MIKGISKKHIKDQNKMYGGVVPKTPSIGTIPWGDLTDKDKEDLDKVHDGTMPGTEFIEEN